ncbi:hypothetical protein, partial [Campylobacter peloridis]|uniref:hypothetical protein n=1 Tax=Campylobacter peloridis TaxID=488546 RepID=UPI001C739C49
NESKAKFLADYLLSKSQYPDENKRLELAHSMIQSLDFLSHYKNNNTNANFENNTIKTNYKEFIDKANKEYKLANTKKDEVNGFITITLKDKVYSFNQEKDDFINKEYYEKIKDLVTKYNQYAKLINEGLASDKDQAFKDLKQDLFSLLAKANLDETKLLALSKEFDKLKDKVSYDSNSHFKIKGDLKAIANLYPILTPINNNNNGSINKPDKPDTPIQPPIDNKPNDNQLTQNLFQQTS